MTSTATPTQRLQSATSPIHKPFSWLPSVFENDPVAQFMSRTMSVCQGIQTCLELAHSADLLRRINEDAGPGEEVPCMLDRGDTERLLLLATASAQLLAEAAEQRIKWLSA